SSYLKSGVEGLVRFGTAAYQHFGLATSFSAVSGNYWAIFSTMGTTNTLFARVNANGTTTDVNIGALPTGFHTYKVLPTSTGFQFLVDGVLKTTIAATFQNTVTLKIGLSDFVGTSGQLLQADRIVLQSYSTSSSGTFTSTVFNAGQQVTWGTAHWT